MRPTRPFPLQHRGPMHKRHAFIPEEILHPTLVSALRRLDVRFVMHEPLPLTRYTTGIAGGTGLSWGMSLNKLVVFNLTQYRKVVFMDADTLALQNLDHLFGPEYPHFSSAVTEACCNGNAPGMPSGGFWVLEPSISEGLRLSENTFSTPGLDGLLDDESAPAILSGSLGGTSQVEPGRRAMEG